MSLAAPEKASKASLAEVSLPTAFVCNKSESILSVIEKCLDNGLGTCLVVEDDNRLVGRITLDDIRKAVLDGALLNPTLGAHMKTLGRRLQNDSSVHADVLRPLLDDAGLLV